MVMPQGEFTITSEVEVIDEADLPTYTYKLDIKRGRIIGMTDRLDAMEQAIFKILNTFRFEHLIYSDDYGYEDLTGSERILVIAELPRRLKEALLQDSRITFLDDLQIDFQKDKAFATFTANTIYGDVDVLREVISFV